VLITALDSFSFPRMKSLREVSLRSWVVLAWCLAFVAGCGEGKGRPSGPVGVASPASVPVDVPVAPVAATPATNGAALEPGPSVAAATSSVAESVVVSIPTNATRVEAVVARVLALCEAGKFIEARDAVRAGVRECAPEPDLEKLRNVEVTVRRQAQEFIRLRADVEQLSSSDPAVYKVAAEHLLCEEVGRIVLRQVVREGAAGPALVAASSLAEVKDLPGVLAIARRITGGSDEPLSESLFLLLPDVATAVPVAEVPALAGWAGGRTGAVVDASFDLVRGAASGSLPPDALRAIADVALAPDSRAGRGATELLAAVFGRVAKRDAKAFNALFGDGKDRHASLKSAVEMAESEPGDRKAWAKGLRYAFLAVDRAQQATGLAGHWPMDGSADERLEDASSKGRHATIRGATAATFVPGVIGKAMESGSDLVSVEVFPGEAFSGLSVTSYCYSAWIRRTKVSPSTKMEGEMVVVGRENQAIGGRLAGLVMDRNGVLSFIHPVTVTQAFNDRDPRKRTEKPKIKNEHITATASRPLEEGRWYHVSGVVLSRAGTVQLFINGRLAAAAAIPAGAVGSELTTPLRIGMGRVNEKKRSSCRFQGTVDDVRVYERALHESEVYGLYASGEL
jgi:hypothetical protein